MAWSEVLKSLNTNLNKALDVLMGELHTTTRTNIINNTNVVRDNINGNVNNKHVTTDNNVNARANEITTNVNNRTVEINNNSNARATEIKNVLADNFHKSVNKNAQQVLIFEIRRTDVGNIHNIISIDGSYGIIDLYPYISLYSSSSKDYTLTVTVDGRTFHHESSFVQGSKTIQLDFLKGLIFRSNLTVKFQTLSSGSIEVEAKGRLLYSAY